MQSSDISSQGAGKHMRPACVLSMHQIYKHTHLYMSGQGKKENKNCFVYVELEKRGGGYNYNPARKPIVFQLFPSLIG